MSRVSNNSVSSKDAVQKPQSKLTLAGRKVKVILTNEDIPFWTGNVGSLARSVHALALPYFARLGKIAKAVAATQFTGLISLPFTIKDLVTGAKDLKKEPKHKTDTALDVISNTGQLAEDVSNIGSALQSLKPALMPFAWIARVSLASTILSAINYVIDGKALYSMHRIKKSAKDEFEYNPSKFVEEHAYRLENQCGVDVEKFKKVVKPLSYTTEKGQENIKTCRKALKQRINYKRLGTALNIVATSIGIAVTAIFAFMTAPAWAVAGTSLLIAGSLLLISKKVIDYYANHKFIKQIKQIKPVPIDGQAMQTT